jgi:hypothetical protein
VTGDEAHDADVVYDKIPARHPEGDVILPPRSTAILSESGTTGRDTHLRTIESHGRVGRQRRSGYCRRNLVETAIFRYNTIIGRRLHARTPPNQTIEAKIGCAVLNQMTSLGMPISARIKQTENQRDRLRLHFFVHQRPSDARSFISAMDVPFRKIGRGEHSSIAA